MKRELHRCLVEFDGDGRPLQRLARLRAYKLNNTEAEIWNVMHSSVHEGGCFLRVKRKGRYGVKFFDIWVDDGPGNLGKNIRLKFHKKSGAEDAHFLRPRPLPRRARRIPDSDVTKSGIIEPTSSNYAGLFYFFIQSSQYIIYSRSDKNNVCVENLN